MLPSTFAVLHPAAAAGGESVSLPGPVDWQSSKFQSLLGAAWQSCGALPHTLESCSHFARPPFFRGDETTQGRRPGPLLTSRHVRAVPLPLLCPALLTLSCMCGHFPPAGTFSSTWKHSFSRSRGTPSTTPSPLPLLSGSSRELCPRCLALSGHSLFHFCTWASAFSKTALSSPPMPANGQFQCLCFECFIGISSFEQNYTCVVKVK